MKTFATVIGLVFTLAASSFTQAAQTADLGLTKIKDSRSSVAYIDADHDFSHYDKIAIAPIVTGDVEINQPSRSALSRSDWKTDEERQARVTDMHEKAFDREFGDIQDLELTDTVDDNTLVLVTRLAEVSPNVGSDPQSMAGRVNVYSEGSGSAVVEMYLIDGKTREVVAVAANARQLGHVVHRSNSVMNGSDVQMAFNMWAKQARQAVEHLPELAADAG